MKTLKTEKDSLLKEKEKEKKSHKGTRPKPPVELKEGMSEEEYKEKKDYYDYLRSLVGDNITAKAYALTELYIRKYGFTYTGMRDTLVYIHEVLQMDIKGDVVGLIPYQYSACEAYQAQQAQVEAVNKDINVKDMYQRKTVYVKPRVDTTKLIDITEIK